MKKHKDVKEILRRNGVTEEDNLNNVTIIGGYNETYVMWSSGTSFKIGNAGTNTPDDVDIVTGDTTLSVNLSGETYFLLSGTSSANVNSIPIEFEYNKNNDLRFNTKVSGETIYNSNTFDAGNGKYYTYLGKTEYGLAFRILDLESSGATITIDSITINGSSTMSTGSTQQLEAVGTYKNGTTTILTDDVIWSIDDENIATITSTGEVITSDEGNTGDVVVTATYHDPLTEDTVTDTFDITVTS